MKKVEAKTKWDREKIIVKNVPDNISDKEVADNILSMSFYFGYEDEDEEFYEIDYSEVGFGKSYFDKKIKLDWSENSMEKIKEILERYFCQNGIVSGDHQFEMDAQEAEKCLLGIAQSVFGNSCSPCDITYDDDYDGE